MKLHLYVALVVAAASTCVALAWPERSIAPVSWDLAAYVALALVLHLSTTVDRSGPRFGSLIFMLHLPAGMLLGPFWAPLVAASGGLFDCVRKGLSPLKTAFNVAQYALALGGALAVYTVAGGEFPPAFVSPGQPAAEVRRDAGLFFLYGLAYFTINALLVNGAIALATRQRFVDVWHEKTRKVILVDITASVVAFVGVLAAAWVDRLFGFGSLGLLLIALPILLVRQTYLFYYGLQTSGREILELMVKAIEARDPYTSGHSRRVQQMAIAIAEELRLSPKQREEVAIAALLHDVGKIHEEFAPLLRAERALTPVEMQVMKTHAAKGAELVGIVSSLRGAVQDSIRHHHERWDGQGYPDGIRGETIPLASRIIHVADSIDAMTSSRPYRLRMRQVDVCAELVRCRASQFDPVVIDAVLTAVTAGRLQIGPATLIREAADSVAPPHV